MWDNPIYDRWARTGKYVHKPGIKPVNSDGELECFHENMETIEEYEGSPYFIRSCPNCGYFCTIKHERLRDDS